LDGKEARRAKEENAKTCIVHMKYQLTSKDMMTRSV
jgi:hypothetical protein